LSEFLANRSAVAGECCGEHHDLFLVWSVLENLLDG